MITGIGHVAFKVSDLEKSLDFYCNKLGLKEAFRLYNDDGTPWIVYIKINSDNFIELFPNGKGVNLPDSEKTGYQHLCLRVDNIFKTLEELKERGIEITGEPTKGLDGNYQYWLKDPDGNPIELMQIMPDSLQAKS